MSKVKYKYNPKTLTYEKAELTLWDRVLKFFSYIGTGLVFAVFFLFIFYLFFDSPKEKRLKRENEQLKLNYTLLNNRVEDLSNVMANLEERDDNIYRVIFEAEPIPKSIRDAGFGGSNRYESLEGFENSQLIIQTTKRLDKLAKQMYIQSKSFDEVIEMAENKEKMLASIPAIQPVANKELKRMASGFGYRIDPHYKVRKFHAGMDFSAPTGTDVYATGDGTVKKTKKGLRGYGYHIIVDHGYGYETLYAHLSEIKVKPGSKVKRGEVIGAVGNTGKSMGPHLHYEVRKNGEAVNPINFYFNDLSPAEYEKMIELASRASQSFD